MPKAPTEILPDPKAVAEELERIAASASFRKAERCLRLLRFVTDCAIEGRIGDLKEYTLGVNALGRPESFDPRVDPVVRLEARRLRLKLAEYYQQEGVDDAVVVELPKGAYIPYFRLRQAPAPDAPTDPPPAVRSTRFIWLAVVGGILCISVAAWVLAHRYNERPTARASIAVLGFRDLSGSPETSWMDAAVSELMDIELGTGQQLRTLPPQNVVRMRHELAITPQPTYPAQVLQRIETNLGVDYGVAGSYLPSGDRVRLDVVLLDMRSGRQIAAVGDEAARDKLPELAEECARRLRAHLGVRLNSDRGSAYPPVEPAAMESYARGMEWLRQSDALSARPYLEQAAAAAPANPLVHSGLAAAWSLLGLDSRALEEAKQAFNSSASLGRVEQLEIEGRYRVAACDWPRAIEVYQALFTLLPDDLENGLLLASAEARGGRAKDAMVTIDALRKLPPSIANDPRIDLAEAQSSGALADFAHTRRAAHTAAEKARQRGARLQYARARLLESGAMQNLYITGYREARAEARGICAELGDRACVAAAFRIEANDLAFSGWPAKARPIYAQVLTISNEIGNQLEKLNALTGIAYTEKQQGDLKAAEADYRKAMEVGAEIGQQKRDSAAIDLAEVLAAQGRIADAKALVVGALEAARRGNDPETAGLSGTILARALAFEGKFSQSVSGYSEAIRFLRTVGDPGELAAALLDFGDIRMQQGDTAAARQNYQEARDLCGQNGGLLQPEIEMAFARLSLAGHQAEDAATHARAALDKFTAAGRDGDRLQAAALLARALMEVGHFNEASSVLAQLPSPDGRGFPIEVVAEFRIAGCLVEAHAARRAGACRALDATAVELSRLGLPPLEKETRIARESAMRTAAAVSR